MTDTTTKNPPDLGRDGEPRGQYGEVEEQEEMAMAMVEGREERRPWEIVGDLREERDRLLERIRVLEQGAEFTFNFPDENETDLKTMLDQASNPIIQMLIEGPVNLRIKK